MSASTPPDPVLLDTNEVIRHLRAGSAPLLAHLQAGGLAFLSLTVLGELFVGAFRSSQPTRTRRQITEFQRLAAVLLPTGLRKNSAAFKRSLLPRNAHSAE